MKSIVVLFIGLLFTSVSYASHCKTGDLNKCAAVLKKLHNAKVPPKKFASSFDDICAENVKFKCIKRTVRGDVNEEMKYSADEHPKGHLFQISLGGENFIYILDLK